jgi:hypothetical protein
MSPESWRVVSTNLEISQRQRGLGCRRTQQEVRTLVTCRVGASLAWPLDGSDFLNSASGCPQLWTCSTSSLFPQMVMLYLYCRLGQGGPKCKCVALRLAAGYANLNSSWSLSYCKLMVYICGATVQVEVWSYLLPSLSLGKIKSTGRNQIEKDRQLENPWEKH